VGLSAAAETLVGILKRVIVNPAVYPRFLEIAELAYGCMDGTKWPFKCCCAVKKLYTHSLL